MALLKLLNGSLSVKVGMGNWEMEWGECEEWGENSGNWMGMHRMWEMEWKCRESGWQWWEWACECEKLG